jgi:hypothetical protein
VWRVGHEWGWLSLSSSASMPKVPEDESGEQRDACNAAYDSTGDLSCIRFRVGM